MSSEGKNGFKNNKKAKKNVKSRVQSLEFYITEKEKIMKLFMYVWYAIWLLAVLFALIRGFAFVFMVMAETSLGIGILVFLVHMFFVLPAIATVILVIKS